MKKVILSILVLASLTTKAQDTTVYTKGAILIQPIIVNAQGDSAYSIVWSAFGLSNNGEGCSTYVTLNGKLNQKLTDFNCGIPSYIVNQWGTDNTIIDDYILSQYPRFKKL